MKGLFPILLLLASCTAFAAKKTIITDKSDNSPIAAATVFSRSGQIIGMTGADGSVGGIGRADLPATVRCLGYEPLSVSELTDTIRLTPDSYELGEVVVTPLDRPILRVVCYIREYSGGITDTDTLQYFAEHMADFYLPTAKVKKFKGNKSPRILKSIMYERYANSSGLDSVARPDYRRDDISWIDLLMIPGGALHESDAIKAGARSDSVAGKHSLKTLMRKTDDMYTIKSDYLADKKSHKWSPAFFKLLGFTIDINRMVGSWAYRPNESGTYRPADLLYGTFALDITGRGKWIKRAFDSGSPVQMHALFDVYPVAFEHLTAEEADHQLHKEAPSTPFTRSPLAAPLPPATRTLVDRARALGSN